jgi:hypothetical protein
MLPAFIPGRTPFPIVNSIAKCGNITKQGPNLEPNDGPFSAGYSPLKLPFFFFPPPNIFIAFFHPPLSLRCVLAEVTVAVPLP